MLASIDFDNNNEMDEREWRSFICAQVSGWWMPVCLGMQTGQTSGGRGGGNQQMGKPTRLCDVRVSYLGLVRTHSALLTSIFSLD